MQRLQESIIACPYCGEQSTVMLDAQERGSEYIEDCQVCCRPIVFQVSDSPDGALDVHVRSEDETW